ncbi:zinc ribbon domain-containing protein [Streptomyces prunicolor]|uniref:zinc ribbon domain-containing protein n=1 Tax=Streptomyces prunicolor TaxID=67348 RepID=UPI0034358195
MSDNYLTLIPTDPYWQPDRAAAHQAKAALSALLPDADARRGLTARWHDTVEVVHCGTNLETIRCPHCGADSSAWWADALQERYTEGFSTLLVTTPCCDTETSLNDLTYDWPMGFASFRIEALNPNRGRLTDQELTSVTAAAGHPLRQILTHI